MVTVKKMSPRANPTRHPVKDLRISGFRSFTDSIDGINIFSDLDCAITLIHGENGIGKTAFLEAVMQSYDLPVLDRNLAKGVSFGVPKAQIFTTFRQSETSFQSKSTISREGPGLTPIDYSNFWDALMTYYNPELLQALITEKTAVFQNSTDSENGDNGSLKQNLRTELMKVVFSPAGRTRLIFGETTEERIIALEKSRKIQISEMKFSYEFAERLKREISEGLEKEDASLSIKILNIFYAQSVAGCMLDSEDENLSGVSLKDFSKLAREIVSDSDGSKTMIDEFYKLRDKGKNDVVIKLADIFKRANGWLDNINAAAKEQNIIIEGLTKLITHKRTQIANLSETARGMNKFIGETFNEIQIESLEKIIEEYKKFEGSSKYIDYIRARIDSAKHIELKRIGVDIYNLSKPIERIFRAIEPNLVFDSVEINLSKADQAFVALQHSEDGDTIAWLAVDQFSKGQASSLSLAIFLANAWSVEFGTESESRLFLLDEAFMHMDEVRRSNALDVIRAIVAESNGQKRFIITTADEYFIHHALEKFECLSRIPKKGESNEWLRIQAIMLGRSVNEAGEVFLDGDVLSVSGEDALLNGATFNAEETVITVAENNPEVKSEEVKKAIIDNLTFELDGFMNSANDTIDLVDGVGPIIRDNLAQQGITTLRQVVFLSKEKLEGIMQEAGIKPSNLTPDKLRNSAKLLLLGNPPMNPKKRDL